MRIARAQAAVAGAVGAAAVVHLLPGAVAWRQARNLLLPGLAGVGRTGHIALTFDDGPDPKSTPPILEALDEQGWKATFFCLGSQVAAAPDLTRELLARGHEIGVHGYTHRSHLRRTARWTVHDVVRARDLIHEVTGVEPVWFRPPYGALSASAIAAARRSGLRLVLWTTWGRDWRPGIDGDWIAGEVRRTYHPGATVLLHDSDLTSAPASWKATLAALPILAEGWHRDGLEVGTLSSHGLGDIDPLLRR